MNTDKIDLLFVVDDSPSMVEEQQSLRRQLPRLVEQLLRGSGAEDGSGFLPANDAHIGVVSADLGTGGFDDALAGCSAWGDDGILQHAPLPTGCADGYPRFLDYTAADPLAISPGQTPTMLAADIGCIAPLGIAGCSYTQPLEAALKALSPSGLGEPPTFLGDDRLGHGDRYNAGFLRNDPRAGLSLLGIVIVTDKDDCSVSDPRLFTDSLGVTPEARCAESPDRLQPTARYPQGFRGLRSGDEIRNEDLVALGIIAGVPADLVDDLNDPAGGVDLSWQASSERFFTRVLDDPRMQITTRADGTLAPACASASASATPPRRLMEVARGFGANMSMASICEDDWSRALDSIRPSRIGDIAVDAGCLPRPLSRSKDGLTSCEVTWELRPHGQGDPGSPGSCDEVPALLSLHEQRPLTDEGGQRCVVRQLAVTGSPSNPLVEAGHGWYYDDFSEARERLCTGPAPHRRIAFTPRAQPRGGLTVIMECVETHYAVTAAGDILDEPRQPVVFDACDPDTADACQRLLRDRQGGPLGDGVDHTLSCHPERRACILGCADGSCPRGWTCNESTPPWCEPGACSASE